MESLPQFRSENIIYENSSKKSGKVRCWPHRLQKIIGSLACPYCICELIETTHDFQCQRCERIYPIRNNKIYFTESVRTEDALDLVKSQLKNWLGSKYYQMAVRVIGPSFPLNYGRAVRQQVKPVEQVVIDLGCGNYRFDENVVTLDSTDYAAVDIVADIGLLPFKGETIDAICSCSVLEHVADLARAVNEISRCTRSNGLGIHYIPFMYPFHASPYDYTRLTYAGAARLFNGWSLIDQSAGTGPVSLFLLCFIEFISTLLSFGVQRLKAPIYLLLCSLTFPLKYLDAPFVGRKSFIGMAPTILTIVRKP